MRRIIFFAAFIIAALLSPISNGATYGGGVGTAADPYQIWTPVQMNMIGANSSDWGKHFILMADIDMSAYAGTQYKIIGNSTTLFTGTFDGNGHVIRNLTYNTTAAIDYVGLLGYTSYATIMDLGVENINLTTGGTYVGGLVGYQSYGTITNCYSAGVVTATTITAASSPTAGGLVGYQYYGTATDCYSTAAVTAAAGVTSISTSYAGGLVAYQDSGTITHCYSTGTVEANSHASPYAYAGGLVGYQYGPITYSRSTGAVNAYSSSSYQFSYTYTGGLVGWQLGLIAYCYSTGSVRTASSATPVTNSSSYAYAGGLVGRASGFIRNCYSTGPVWASTPTFNYAHCYAGGLVGNGSGTIQKSYSTGYIYAHGKSVYTGGLVGGGASSWDSFWDKQTSGQETSYGGGTGKTTAQMKIRSTFTGTEDLWDFTNETANGSCEIWRMCADGISYPQLNWQFTDGDLACPDGVGVEDLDPFIQWWLLTTCIVDNNYCGGTDMNASGGVDMADIALFAAHWLEN